MTPRTYKLKRIKGLIERVWKNPKAQLLENHYKFLCKILREEYPNTVGGISPDTLDEICKTIVYADRYLRNKRQGTQNKLKSELVKEFVPTLR